MKQSMINDELSQLAQWQAQGQLVALATVVSTWGSSPRPVGSHLAISEGGDFVGSVSGGCIEGAVIAEALEAMQDGQSRMLDFGVSDEQAWEVGLSCGGKITVYLEPVVKVELLKQLLEAREKKQGVAVVTRLQDGKQCLLLGDGNEQPDLTDSLCLNSEEFQKVDELLTSGRSAMLSEGIVSEGNKQLFVRCYTAPARLFIIGAVHIAQALTPMAAIAGFDVTVIDPRRAFCKAERFLDAAVNNNWPDEVLSAADIDNQTAIVTLSHDPKIDDPGLIEALRSPAFYIGSLGSRRTHAKRIERLTEQGFSEQELKRIHAPIGLNLGGRAHAEIAVSILSQIVQTRYQGSLSDKVLSGVAQ